MYGELLRFQREEGLPLLEKLVDLRHLVLAPPNYRTTGNSYPAFLSSFPYFS